LVFAILLSRCCWRGVAYHMRRNQRLQSTSRLYAHIQFLRSRPADHLAHPFSSSRDVHCERVRQLFGACS
jgi:hypothetical protein